jgi:hypothetical protein
MSLSNCLQQVLYFCQREPVEGIRFNFRATIFEKVDHEGWFVKHELRLGGHDTLLPTRLNN